MGGLCVFQAGEIEKCQYYDTFIMCFCLGVRHQLHSPLVHGAWLSFVLSQVAQQISGYLLVKWLSKPYSRFSRDVTAAMLVYRIIAKKFFWEFDSIIMQNLSDILPLFCTPTWPSPHVSENQELSSPFLPSLPSCWHWFRLFSQSSATNFPATAPCSRFSY